jgi:hypothetical protein
MRQAIVFVAGVVLAGFAFAGNCPNVMKEVDAKLKTAKLSAADKEKVEKLRKSGEDHHKAGKHAESMKDLGEAKKILGI